MSGTAADRCKVPRAFWQAVEHIGVPPAVLLRQAKLPATLHLNEQGQVTTVQYFALWRALEELKPEPGLGLMLVQSVETAVHPPSSLAAFYARDYRDGLLRIARFKRLCSPEQLQVREGEDECVVAVEWPYATDPEPAISTDVTFASLVELGRRGTGQHLTPKRVELVRPRPKSDVHQKYFECQIRYGAARNLLVLKSADLDRPFPGHNKELLEILTPALASALGELEARSSVREQVKVVLKRSLASGRPELSDVARDLGLSERTLQRRITDEGASFRELLVEARQELGRQLLSDPTADIDEVACAAVPAWEGFCSLHCLHRTNPSRRCAATPRPIEMNKFDRQSSSADIQALPDDIAEELSRLPSEVISVDDAPSISPPAALTSDEVRTIVISLMLTMFLAALDQTIVATALPTIGRQFQDVSNLSWVITAYLLASTAVAPVFGTLSDIYGRKAMSLRNAYSLLVATRL